MIPVVSILAFAALIATSNADFIEYDPGYADAFIKKFTVSQVKADLVNFGTPVKFKPGKRTPTWVSFVPTELPDPEKIDLASPDHKCEYFCGVYFEGTHQAFCNITSFTIRQYHFSSTGRDLLTYRLKFKLRTAIPFLLVVPVFKLPAQESGYDLDTLMAWGMGEKVGTVGPITVEDNLWSVSPDRPLTIEFHWLERLLHSKIYKVREDRLPRDHEVGVLSYITRPLLVSQDVLEKGSNFITSGNPSTSRNAGV